MSTLKPTLVTALALLAVTAASAASLSKAESDELAYVAQTLATAELCKVPPARYSELSRYKSQSAASHVASGVRAADVEQAFARGVASAKAQAGAFDSVKCAATFEDIDKANKAFRNLNKTLDDLTAVTSSLERAGRAK